MGNYRNGVAFGVCREVTEIRMVADKASSLRIVGDWLSYKGR